MMNRTIGPLLAALALAACGQDGTGAPDAASFEETPCVSTAHEHVRECPCLDGGLAMVVACSPEGGRCFAYATTCTDPGYTSCDARAPAEVAALCRAFCDAHGGESWASGCGLFP